MKLSQNVWKNEKLIAVLSEGNVAVMPTDTIYGIVGKALDESTVLRIYEIKKRAPEKPCIILIGDIKELEKFSVLLAEEQKNKLKEYWPFDLTQDFQFRPTSIILDCPEEKFSYLHRGTKTLAFRLPASKELRDLLVQVGPLIAPSANPEGLPPAKNINEAKTYFSDSVNMYIDGGEIFGEASKIIKLNNNGSVDILRY